MTDNMTDITLKKEKIQLLRDKYIKYIHILDNCSQNLIDVKEVKHWIKDLVSPLLPEFGKNGINGSVEVSDYRKDCESETDSDSTQTKTLSADNDCNTINLNDSLFDCDNSPSTKTTNNLQNNRQNCDKTDSGFQLFSEEILNNNQNNTKLDDNSGTDSLKNNTIRSDSPKDNTIRSDSLIDNTTRSDSPIDNTIRSDSLIDNTTRSDPPIDNTISDSPKDNNIEINCEDITETKDTETGSKVSESEDKTEKTNDRFDSIGSEISSDNDSDNNSDHSMSRNHKFRLRSKCDKKDSDSSEVEFNDSSDSPESKTDSDSDYQQKSKSSKSQSSQRHSKYEKLLEDFRLKYASNVRLIRLTDDLIDLALDETNSASESVKLLEKQLFDSLITKGVVCRKMKTIKEKERKDIKEEDSDSDEYKRLCRVPKITKNSRIRNGSKREKNDSNSESNNSEFNDSDKKRLNKKLKTSTPKTKRVDSDLESDIEEQNETFNKFNSINNKSESKMDALDSDISSDEEVVKKETRNMKKKNKKEKKHDSEEEENGSNDEENHKSKNSPTKGLRNAKNGVDSENEDKTIDIESDDEITLKRKVTKRRVSDDDDYNEDKDSDQSSDNFSVSEDSSEGPSSSDSNSGSESNSTSKKKNKSKKKHKKDKKGKRKRVRVHDSSDDDDCKVLSDENDSPNKSRKNIRKIISDKKIKKQTKDAAEAERERVKRIRDKQKEYNDLIKTRTLKSADVKELILEFDKETKEPLVEVDETLVKFLKPHQKNGIEFMYNCIVETIDQLETSEGSGAILAHSMGLGKTLQVITFLYTILTHKEIKKSIKRALVICPVNTIKNWANEFRVWLVDNDLDDLLVFEMFDAKTPGQRAEILTTWHKRGGVMIIGLTLFSSLVMGGRGKKPQKFVRDAIQKCLLDPGPEVVICDEGHLLKNEKTAYNKAVSQIRSVRRVVLTGTPLQNNLNEYHVMVHFVKPNLLGTKKEFQNRFVNPITNGQHEDSTDYDVKIMKKRVHILHTLLNGCVHRCDYNVLVPYLQPKYEYVLSVMLTEKQIELYSYYLKNLTDKQRISLLADYGSLRLIWNHPILLYQQHRRRLDKANEDSLDEFIDDDEDAETPASCDSDVELIDDNKAGPSIPIAKRRMRTRFGKNEEIPEEEEEDKKSEVSDDGMSNAWFAPLLKREESNQIELSGKFILLFAILEECEKLGDKILLFSQSLDTLDLVEEMLKIRMERAVEESKTKVIPEIDLESGATNDATHVWFKNKDYFRLDGSTASDYRKAWIDVFNNEDNYRARLFLISTKAGGLGINLVGANRCIIFDASWNPTHDVQAIFRIFRFGQKKPVYVYRFVAQGTMEEKIYERQIIKQSLSCRVVDEQAIQRHFKAGEVSELYVFKPDTNKDRPTPKLPKDRLLADLLLQHKEFIVNYHEHDSLLENKPEEDMTEEEKMAAWNEYEQEKDALFTREQQERELRMQREYMMAQAQAQAQQQQQFQQQQYQQYAQLYQQMQSQTSNQFSGNVTDYQSLLTNTIFQNIMRQQAEVRKQQQQKYQEARAQRMAELAQMQTGSSSQPPSTPGVLPGYDRMTIEDIAKYLKHLNNNLSSNELITKIFGILDTGLNTCTRELNLAKSAVISQNTPELRQNYEKLAKEVYNLNRQKTRAQQMFKSGSIPGRSGPSILRTSQQTSRNNTNNEEAASVSTPSATKTTDELIEEVD